MYILKIFESKSNNNFWHTIFLYAVHITSHFTKIKLMKQENGAFEMTHNEQKLIWHARQIVQIVDHYIQCTFSHHLSINM